MLRLSFLLAISCVFPILALEEDDDASALVQLRGDVLTPSISAWAEAIEGLFDVLPGFHTGGFQIGLHHAKDLLASLGEDERLLIPTDLSSEVANGPKKVRGVTFTIETHSDDGTYIDMWYDHGCVGPPERRTCSFAWGEPVAKKAELVLMKDIEEGSWVELKLGLDLGGFLKSSFGSLLTKPLSVKCPACGGTCNIDSLKIPINIGGLGAGGSILGGLAQKREEPELDLGVKTTETMPGCPLRAGKVLLDDDKNAKLPKNPLLNAMSISPHISESVYHKDGTLAFSLNISVEIGSMIEGAGVGGGW